MCWADARGSIDLCSAMYVEAIQTEKAPGREIHIYIVGAEREIDVRKSARFWPSFAGLMYVHTRSQVMEGNGGRQRRRRSSIAAEAFNVGGTWSRLSSVVPAVE